MSFYSIVNNLFFNYYMSNAEKIINKYSMKINVYFYFYIIKK